MATDANIIKPATGAVPMPGMGGASNGQTPISVPSVTPTSLVNPMQQIAQNPYTPVTASTPTSGYPTLTPGGVVPGSTVQGNNINWTDQDFSVTGDLKDTYGAGTGTAISQVLQGMGTKNDAAIQALINQTNLAAGKQYGNIQAQQAAAGLTPNSSAAALAAGDFYGDVNTSLQSTIANMENQQQNTLLQTLLGTGAAHGPDVSTFQSIMSMLPGISSGIGSGANALSAAGVGGSTGGFSELLSALGAFA